MDNVPSHGIKDQPDAKAANLTGDQRQGQNMAKDERLGSEGQQEGSLTIKKRMQTGRRSVR